VAGGVDGHGRRTAEQLGDSGDRLVRRDRADTEPLDGGPAAVGGLDDGDSPEPAGEQASDRQDADRAGPSTQTGSPGTAAEILIARRATANGSASAPSASLTVAGRRRSIPAGTATDSA
jgi:hypothetical protein